MAKVEKNVQMEKNPAQVTAQEVAEMKAKVKAEKKAVAVAEKKAKAEAKVQEKPVVVESKKEDQPAPQADTKPVVPVVEAPAPAEPKATVNLEKAPKAEAPKADEPKAEIKADEPPAAPEPEAKKEPVVWGVNDISSPSHERFSLKQGSKRVIELSPAEIVKLELGFDASKFKNRNNYIEVTKNKLMKLVQEGKFTNESVTVNWAAAADKFPEVQAIAPEPKKTKTAPAATVDAKTTESLNFFEEEKNDTAVNF